MEIGCLGIGDRACIGISSRRAGLSHRLAARARICRVRKTSALVDHTHRFPDWNRGRVILPWLRHRTVADGWSRTLLVNHNFAGGFFVCSLVGRCRECSDCACCRRNLDRVLSVASRSGGEHDRPLLGQLIVGRLLVLEAATTA